MHDQSTYLDTTQKSRALSRRRFLQLAAMSSVGAFGGSLIWPNDVVRKFENDTVVPLTPWFINTYLVRSERLILVDTGLPSDHDTIYVALTVPNVQPADLALVFITDGHYDHFGSAIAFDIPVGCHPDEDTRLTTGVPTSVKVLSNTGRLVRLFPQGEQPAVPVTPDILLEGGETLGSKGLVIHNPDHTQGSLSLLIDDIAIIGDLITGHLLYPNNPDYPFFIDNPAHQSEILSSLEQLLDAGAQMFIPGHGLPFNPKSAA
jgi:hydroxyacylglutathione hydrolase